MSYQQRAEFGSNAKTFAQVERTPAKSRAESWNTGLVHKSLDIVRTNCEYVVKITNSFRELVSSRKLRSQEKTNRRGIRLAL
jgi:hypothetical protein